ncbi:sigma-70 family RNA polymerase sigma factor [Pseudomonas sp. ODNR1LW]|nr:sigma-70 family RNA polymerase sigma factor [Pseudomonas sp. ODNR1LW]
MTSPSPAPLKRKFKKIRHPIAPGRKPFDTGLHGRSAFDHPRVRSTVAQSAKAELLAIYLDRRPALVRFFTARTRSADRAQDIVQEIYVRLQALSEAAAEEIKAPVPLLYRIGGNLMLDQVRAGRRSAARDQSWTEISGAAVDGISVADEPSPEDAAWARLKLDQVAVALEGMPPNARMAFRLHKIDGLTHAEVAARIGVSRSSVEKYVSAVLARLLERVGWP